MYCSTTQFLYSIRVVEEWAKPMFLPNTIILFICQLMQNLRFAHMWWTKSNYKVYRSRAIKYSRRPRSAITMTATCSFAIYQKHISYKILLMFYSWKNNSVLRPHHQKLQSIESISDKLHPSIVSKLFTIEYH